MIDLKLIYELYIEAINNRLTQILILIDETTKPHEELKLLIKEFQVPLVLYTNTTYAQIVKKKSTKFVDTLTFPSSNVYVKGKKINFEALKLYIVKYTEINKNLTTYLQELEQYKKELITFTLYRNIIVSFNTKIIDKIVNENYLFTLIPSFGDIGVIQNYNKRKRPNWGVSNKNKAVIEERGGVPYRKVDEELALENGVEYKGEKWLVYHPPLDFYLHWHIKGITKKFNPFLKYYKYTPARGKNSIVTKLQVIKRNLTKATSLYTRTLNYERI